MNIEKLKEVLMESFSYYRSIPILDDETMVDFIIKDIISNKDIILQQQET